VLAVNKSRSISHGYEFQLWKLAWFEVVWWYKMNKNKLWLIHSWGSLLIAKLSFILVLKVNPDYSSEHFIRTYHFVFDTNPKQTRWTFFLELITLTLRPTKQGEHCIGVNMCIDEIFWSVAVIQITMVIHLSTELFSVKITLYIMIDFDWGLISHHDDVLKWKSIAYLLNNLDCSFYFFVLLLIIQPTGKPTAYFFLWKN